MPSSFRCGAIPDDAIDHRWISNIQARQRTLFACDEKWREKKKWRQEQKKKKIVRRKKPKCREEKRIKKKIIENTPKLTQNEMDIGNTYRGFQCKLIEMNFFSSAQRWQWQRRRRRSEKKESGIERKKKSSK